MLKYENNYYNVEIKDILALANSKDSRLFNKININDRDVITNCPFHGEDKNPSLGVKKSNGVVHCFSCGYSNNFTGFVKDLGLGDLFSTEEVISKNREIDLFLKKECKFKNLPNPYVKNKTLYWTKRKITKETKDLFELGFDTKTNEVTFPMKDICGNIVGFIRRSVNKKRFKIDKDMDKILYGLCELYLTGYKRNDIIIVESNIDALYLWSLGYPALALNGTGSYKQYEILNQLSFRLIYLMLDNDVAGRLGAERIRRNVKRKFFKQLKYPLGVKDVNDMTKEQVVQSLMEGGYFD